MSMFLLPVTDLFDFEVLLALSLSLFLGSFPLLLLNLLEPEQQHPVYHALHTILLQTQTDT